MKWYGALKLSQKLLIYKKKKNYKYHFKQSAFYVRQKINLNYRNLILYFPNNWNFLILSQLKHLNLIHVFLYNQVYFFNIPLFTPFILLKYDSQVNSLILKFFFKNNFFGLFWNFFKKVFFSFTKVFFKKLKFKGKGYYIYKNIRNTVAMQLGYSHIMYLYAFFVSVKFLTKTSILMFGINTKDIFYAARMLRRIRSINIFTGKGIRFSRQVVYRKTGKVSSYR